MEHKCSRINIPILYSHIKKAKYKQENKTRTLNDATGLLRLE